jgi:hypothetical protein
MIGIKIMSKYRKIYEDKYSSVVVSIFEGVQNTRRYQGKIICKIPTTGEFVICVKTFNEITDWIAHVRVLLKMSSTYETDPHNPIRMFV